MLATKPSGIKEGFRIGFNYGKVSYKSAKWNLQSAETNPDVVTAYLHRSGVGKTTGSATGWINTRGAG